jgi:hypothetical protein
MRNVGKAGYLPDLLDCKRSPCGTRPIFQGLLLGSLGYAADLMTANSTNSGSEACPHRPCKEY